MPVQGFISWSNNGLCFSSRDWGYIQKQELNASYLHIINVYLHDAPWQQSYDQLSWPFKWRWAKLVFYFSNRFAVRPWNSRNQVKVMSTRNIKSHADFILKGLLQNRNIYTSYLLTRCREKVDYIKKLNIPHWRRKILFQSHLQQQHPLQFTASKLILQQCCRSWLEKLNY